MKTEEYKLLEDYCYEYINVVPKHLYNMDTVDINPNLVTKDRFKNVYCKNYCLIKCKGCDKDCSLIKELFEL